MPVRGNVPNGGDNSVRLSFPALRIGVDDADPAKYQFIIPYPEVGKAVAVVSICPAASSSSDRSTYDCMNESSYEIVYSD
jgi:hypothetical protein